MIAATRAETICIGPSLWQRRKVKRQQRSSTLRKDFTLPSLHAVYKSLISGGAVGGRQRLGACKLN